MKKITKIIICFSQNLTSVSEIGTLNTIHLAERKYKVNLLVIFAHKVLQALKAKLEKELRQIVNVGYFKRIGKPTNWVNGPAIAGMLNGEVRISLDPWTMLWNANILSQSSVFLQIVDAFSVYWQIRVDEKCSHFLEFGSPLQRCCFKQYPHETYLASQFSNQKLPPLFQMSQIALFFKMI